jgi:hypothetical protein
MKRNHAAGFTAVSMRHRKAGLGKPTLIFMRKKNENRVIVTAKTDVTSCGDK